MNCRHCPENVTRRIESDKAIENLVDALRAAQDEIAELKKLLLWKEAMENPEASKVVAMIEQGGVRCFRLS